MLAFSCELREAGAYKALEAVGVPVLIVRGADGEWRFAERHLHATYLGPPDLSAAPPTFRRRGTDS